MRKNERISDKHPALYSYGSGRHVFLSSGEAAEATVDQRIASVWPFLVRRVFAFQKSLKPRERVNYDADDVVNELWITLRLRDEIWTPERGKYITFAAMIIDRELCAIRDRSRTVESPRNSSCRLKKYKEQEDIGELSSRCRQTAADILRTGEGPKGIVGGMDREPGVTSGPPDEAIGSEAHAAALDAIKSSMAKMSAFEAHVLGCVSGLWGREEESVWSIAWRCKVDQAVVRRAKDRAVAKMRKHLSATNHPVLAS